MRKVLLIIFAIAPVFLYAQTIDTLVNVGDYNLHFNIIEGNEIVFLFESGAGDDATVWDEVIQPLSDSTGATIVTYDRAGFGESSLFQNDINIREEIIGLENCLIKLGYSQNYILVGHSYGGFCSTLFASRNPNKVIGYIDIDANLPCMFNEEIRIRMYANRAEFLDSIRVPNPGLYNLGLSFWDDVEIIRNAPISPGIKVIDVVDERQPYDSLLMIICHKEFVSKSINRNMLIAENSGHYIFRDNPEVVLSTLVSMYRSSKKDE